MSIRNVCLHLQFYHSFSVYACIYEPYIRRYYIISKEKNHNEDNDRKYSRLTLDDRMNIHLCLNEGRTANYIAAKLGRTVSTVTREIRNHMKVQKTRKNDCKSKNDCARHNVCQKDKVCRGICSKCSRVPCKKYCPNYTPSTCEKLESFPYVCNACAKRAYCSYEKQFYEANEAHNAARNTLVNSRNGFNLTAAEIIEIDKLASPMIKNGLTPYHVKQTYGDALPCSESTLRRLIHDSMLDVKDIDLPEVVKRKKRKKRREMHNEVKKIPVSKVGHRFTDYNELMETYTGMVVQMDCVEGIKTDKATLLTLHWPAIHMQIAIVMAEHTAVEVVKALDMIEETLGSREMFHKYFGVILTDNGHEFMDIKRMERSIYGGKRTTIYFCEPNRSDQKSECECNHKLIRRIIPKGTSLESFQQSDITLMMNHINSYKRNEIMGKSPYEFARFMMPSDFDDFCFSLGLKEIPAGQVILAPKLLQGHSTKVNATENEE